jgi:hypothetical protein
MTDGGLSVVTNLNDHLRVGAKAYTRNLGRISNGHVQLDGATRTIACKTDSASAAAR